MSNRIREQFDFSADSSDDQVSPKPNKSPNWDDREASLSTHPAGQRLKGWPFNEDFPSKRNGNFKIILMEGEIVQATIDLSTQYRTEGLQWKSDGKTWDKQQVAAWMEV